MHPTIKYVSRIKQALLHSRQKRVVKENKKRIITQLICQPEDASRFSHGPTKTNWNFNCGKKRYVRPGRPFMPPQPIIKEEFFKGRI
jgi:hypothetical protein